MRDHAYLASLAGAAKGRRQQLGLNQGELAELAQCSTRFVHTLEAGKPTLRLDKLMAVLRVLGLRLRLELGQGLVVDEALVERS